MKTRTRPPQARQEQQHKHRTRPHRKTVGSFETSIPKCVIRVKSADSPQGYAITPNERAFYWTGVGCKTTRFCNEARQMFVHESFMPLGTLREKYPQYRFILTELK